MNERIYHQALDICKSWSFNSSLSLTSLIFQAQVCSYVYRDIVLTNSTGYHMCTHIAKSLQTLCKAIQNAVQTYNTAAIAMSPPTLPLTGQWPPIIHS